MRLTTRVAEGDATDSTQVTEGATVTPVEAEGAAALCWRGREGDAAHSTQGEGCFADVRHSSQRELEALQHSCELLHQNGVLHHMPVTPTC